jgi:hypothetical protein
MGWLDERFSAQSTVCSVCFDSCLQYDGTHFLDSSISVNIDQRNMIGIELRKFINQIDADCVKKICFS